MNRAELYPIGRPNFADRAGIWRYGPHEDGHLEAGRIVVSDNGLYYVGYLHPKTKRWRLLAKQYEHRLAAREAMAHAWWREQ